MSNDLTIVGYAGDLSGTETEFRFFDPLVRNEQDELFVVGSSDPTDESHLITAQHGGPLLFDLPESIQIPYQLPTWPQDFQQVVVAGPRIVELLMKYLPESPLTQGLQQWPVITEAGHRGAVSTIERIQVGRSASKSEAFRVALQELRDGTVHGEAYELFLNIYPEESLEVLAYLGIYATVMGDEELIAGQLTRRAEKLRFTPEMYRLLISQVGVAYGLGWKHEQ